MPAFTLRNATPQDEAAVTEVLKTSYTKLLSSCYDEALLAKALPLMTRASPALLSGGSYFVAETGDDALVGCGVWSRERPGSAEIVPKLGHIRHFAVHPAWIGRGIGRAIYATCAEQARSTGIRQFDCYASLNAQGFYAALGFRSVRRVDVPMSATVSLPGILMERPI